MPGPGPALTTINVNQYLINISSNATAIASLASDLQSNFLTALTSRFTLSTWQQTRITNFDPLLIAGIANNFAAAANAWATYNTFPLEAVVTGIIDSSSLTAAGSYAADSGWSFHYDPPSTITIDYIFSCGGGAD
jgi:hypothetical protein